MEIPWCYFLVISHLMYTFLLFFLKGLITGCRCREIKAGAGGLQPVIMREFVGHIVLRRLAPPLSGINKSFLYTFPITVK